MSESSHAESDSSPPLMGRRRCCSAIIEMPRFSISGEVPSPTQPLHTLIGGALGEKLFLPIPEQPAERRLKLEASPISSQLSEIPPAGEFGSECITVSHHSIPSQYLALTIKAYYMLCSHLKPVFLTARTFFLLKGGNLKSAFLYYNVSNGCHGDMYPIFNEEHNLGDLSMNNVYVQ